MNVSFNFQISTKKYLKWKNILRIKINSNLQIYVTY